MLNAMHASVDCDGMYGHMHSSLSLALLRAQYRLAKKMPCFR
jgi:hypothetical protein